MDLAWKYAREMSMYNMLLALSSAHLDANNRMHSVGGVAAKSSGLASTRYSFATNRDL